MKHFSLKNYRGADVEPAAYEFGVFVDRANEHGTVYWMNSAVEANDEFNLWARPSNKKISGVQIIRYGADGRGGVMRRYVAA